MDSAYTAVNVGRRAAGPAIGLGRRAGGPVLVAALVIGAVVTCRARAVQRGTERSLVAVGPEAVIMTRPREPLLGAPLTSNVNRDHRTGTSNRM